MKNKIAIVCRLFFGIAVAVCLALGVSAQDALGILTLDCHISLESGVRPLAGDTYALVPVADAVVEEGPAISYTTRPEFAAFDCNWAAQSASQLHKTAIAMQDTAQKLTDGCPTGVTDADGRLTLKNLEPCLYLVLRVQTAPANADTLADPFLVSVPLLEEGELYSTVATTPKFAVEETPEPPPSPKPTPVFTPAPTLPPTATTPPTGQLPQTGQLNWPIPILLVAGAGLLMLGLALRRKQEKSDHET